MRVPDIVRFNIRLRELGIRTGARKIYWVRYETEHGPCQEIYLSQRGARERAVEIAKQKDGPYAMFTEERRPKTFGLTPGPTGTI